MPGIDRSWLLILVLAMGRMGSAMAGMTTAASAGPGIGSAAWDRDPALALRGLIARIAPAHLRDFRLEYLSGADGEDVFELESSGGKIILRGNSPVSMAVAFNYYLNYYCHVYVSWYVSDRVTMPAVLPLVPERIHKTTRLRRRFFLNYCTFGYSMPWWTFADWERLIDWMALNGINMPLAVTGEEATWYRVWRQLGLTDAQARGYFTGAAHLPWNRMSNLDKWQGPLSLGFIRQQAELQKKILRRERSFGMKPVLPAFAGHVPQALLEKYPSARVSRLSAWGGFADAYRSWFLDPFDPLFARIQRVFLAEQEKMYGSDHIYGVDPFNEVQPPQWDTGYLGSAASAIYRSLVSQDSAATWLMMTWVFYFERENWTNDRIRAFLGGAPKGKMMLLDYYAENQEVWKMTDSYFGQPFIWCYLGNFGGNTMLAGNPAEVGRRLDTVMGVRMRPGAAKEVGAAKGVGAAGVGSTLEGLDVNPVVYDFLFGRVWSGDGSGDRGSWAEHWADLRCGGESPAARKAWDILWDKVYRYPARLGQATLTNARPSLRGSGNWTTDDRIGYNNRDLLRAWGLLLSDSNCKGPGYRYDVVNIGRQVLGNYFAVLRDSFSAAYESRDLRRMNRWASAMSGLLDDLDRLLAADFHFILGAWLAGARAMGAVSEEKNRLETNARMIVTTWGGKGQSLNDYGNRGWAGLMKNYYGARWKLFLHAVTLAVANGRSFDAAGFNREVTSFEWNWVHGHEHYRAMPKGDAVAIARRLYQKYASNLYHLH